MSRRPASDAPILHVIEDVPFKIATSTLKYLPAAPAFIRVLLHRGVSAHVAGEYARLAAKVIRAGRAGAPEAIAQRSERTAINQYWDWVAVTYADRLRPVIRAFADDNVRRGVGWLRVGSIVPPMPGKRIPRLTRMATLQLDPVTQQAISMPGEVSWVETPAWTLHVPHHSLVAIHTDPCADCVPFELDATQLEVIATAFEGAWGHRHIERVPPECFLFGPPPLDVGKAARPSTPAGKVVALLPPGVLADTVTNLRGHVTDAVDSCLARLSESAVDVVMISRETAGLHLHALLAAVQQAWERGSVETVRVDENAVKYD